MEKEPFLRRVVGGTDEQKERVLQLKAEHGQARPENFVTGEVLNPTKEELLAIEEVVHYANEISQKYGGKQISEDRIYIAKDTLVENASFEFTYDAIIVPRHRSPVVFKHVLLHECLHKAAYGAVQIRQEGDRVVSTMYRSGLAMKGRENEGYYFGQADEALIANFTHRFVTETLSADPRFKEELAAVETVKQWLLEVNKRMPGLSDDNRADNVWFFKNIFWLPNAPHLVAKISDSTMSESEKAAYVQGYCEVEIRSGNVLRERASERIAFDKVVTRLTTSTDDGSITREMVLDLFARAHFSGNYLPLARLVESVLGKGSFREIAIELGVMKVSDDNKKTP